MKFSTWLMGRSAGYYGGNVAYYSAKQQQASESKLLQEIARELASEYRQYQEIGGKLDLHSWLNERHDNNSMSLEEFAARFVYCQFYSEHFIHLNNPERDRHFVVSSQNARQVALFLNIDDAQFTAFFTRKPFYNDFLDDATLNALVDAMIKVLISSGSTETEPLEIAITYLCLTPGRCCSFINDRLSKLGIPQRFELKDGKIVSFYKGKLI